MAKHFTATGGVKVKPKAKPKPKVKKPKKTIKKEDADCTSIGAFMNEAFEATSEERKALLERLEKLCAFIKVLP